MDLFTNLSDDQIAIIGCVVAFLTCMGAMSLSYHLGQASRRSQAAVRLKTPGGSRANDRPSSRKAA